MKKWLLAALLWCVFLPAQGEVRINEVLCSNGMYENGKAYSWVEIKNTGDTPESLAGARLAYLRKGERYTYEFPEGAVLPAQGYGVVFCVGADGPPAQGKDFYAPFELSPKGGTLILSRDEEIWDRAELGAQWGNISFGRVGDGEEWLFLPEASRKGANPAQGYGERCPAPEFSLPGGFYDGVQTAFLSAAPGAVIRFTTDGSEPTDQSPACAGTFPVNLGVTCLRARAFQEGLLPSETVTQTYFVGVERYSAVVSLVTDEKYLFDSRTGALVPGNGKIKNYEQDWEYPLSVEYFDEAGQRLLHQGATFRVTGATSRAYGQKTLSLFARSAWGDKRFYFSPFAHREGWDGFKSLTLRAAGTESFLTRFRDALLTSRAAGLGVLYQEAVPVEVYLNGQYWGHYNLREKINKHMIAQWESVTDGDDIDKIDILKGRYETQQGSRADWDELIAFCKTRDLNDPENLRWVEERLDTENYFLHTAIQMIVGNTDIGNVRYYRVPGGKWKCALFDLDAGMENLKQGPIRFYNKTPQENSDLFFHEPFAALMRVPEKRAEFLSLFGRALLRYRPKDLEAEIDWWEARLAPLMPRQIKRWPKSSPASLAIWQYEVRALRKICQKRPAEALDMLCTVYQVTQGEREAYFSEIDLSAP